MRIEAPAGSPVAEVYLWLTPSEASELRDVLEQLIAAHDDQRHEHVASADYQTEISVVVTRS